MDSDEHDPRQPSSPTQPPRHLETTDVRNLHVDEQHIGSMLAHQSDGVLTTITFAEQNDVLFFHEQSNQSVS